MAVTLIIYRKEDRQWYQRKNATIQELDEGILNRLISRILVGEVKKVDGEKFQEIKIIYNFVGEIPAVTE